MLYNKFIYHNFYPFTSVWLIVVTSCVFNSSRNSPIRSDALSRYSRPLACAASISFKELTISDVIDSKVVISIAARSLCSALRLLVWCRLFVTSFYNWFVASVTYWSACKAFSVLGIIKRSHHVHIPSWNHNRFATINLLD